MSNTISISKRKQFGDALAFIRGEANLSRHIVADKTRVTTKIVEGWESGDSVPSTGEWQRLRAVFPPMASASSRYRDLYAAAVAEHLAVEQAKTQQTAESGDVTAAIHLLVEAMPSLRSMTIDIADDGEVSVSYKTREVRVVEDSGTLRVKR